MPTTDTASGAPDHPTRTHPDHPTRTHRIDARNAYGSESIVIREYRDGRMHVEHTRTRTMLGHARAAIRWLGNTFTGE